MIDTIKSNRLIAEFMGIGKTYMGDVIIKNGDYKLYNIIAGTKDYYFNSSWDWLMPVVEKISKTELPEQDEPHLNWLPFPRTFGMLNEETGHFMVRFNRHVLHQAPTLIEATYLAVVDFIELNQTKS